MRISSAIDIVTPVFTFTHHLLSSLPLITLLELQLDLRIEPVAQAVAEEVEREYR